MLDVNPDTVCRLIDLAREFHAQEEVVIPDEPESPGDDWAIQILAAHGSDATFQEFKTIVEDLEPDQQQQVVALLWLGREDYSIDEWEEAVEEARYNWSDHTAEYLMAHPYLADHLALGLELHGYGCE